MKIRNVLSRFALLAAIALVAVRIPTAGAEAPPTERDFFGTVVAVGETSIIVRTEDGDLEVTVTEATRVRLPLKRDAGLADLIVGDLLALSLEEVDGELVADKVFLIPGKTSHRHVPGEVIAVSDTEITIQPPGEAQEPITFDRTLTTDVRLHRGATELAAGAFVIIVAARDPVTGELLLNAGEIHVTPRPVVDETSEDDGQVVRPGAESKADIRGVFQGIDEDGNWIVSGIKVAVDADTDIETGVVVGQLVKIEAILRPDGFPLASEVEAVDGDGRVPGKTTLEGVFEGVDDDGKWIVSGTAVAVGPATDTDGLPDVGQRVKVKALLQPDGSLLAREIENKGGSQRGKQDSRRVKLEGTFQGIDEDGNWIVSGRKVSVGPLTRLERTPAVGYRIKVKAVLREDGSLLAQKVEGEKGDGRRAKSKAEVRGVLEAIRDDGTLIVNGISVALSVLTELEGDLQVGDFVKVEGLVQADGSLLASEVESKGSAEEADVPEPSNVEIEGIIEKVNADGTFTVNGITVATSVLSEIKGALAEGVSVKVEGVFLEDGTVLARELKGEGRRATASGTEVKVKGLLETVQRDDEGNVVSVVVDGLTIALEALTDVEGLLEPGSILEIKAIISDGEFLASKIEARRGRGRAEPSELKIEGIIESLQLDDQGRITSVTVNGVELRVGALTEVEGDLQVGGSVEIKGSIGEGTLQASKVESDGGAPEPAGPAEFKLEGQIEIVQRDDNGNIVNLVVNGLTVDVETLTRVEGTLEPGATVEIKGVLSGGALVASKIESDEEGGGRVLEQQDRDGKQATEIKIEGVVESVQRDEDGRIISVTVDGVEVAIGDLTDIEGALEEGGRIEIRADLSDGGLVARKAEGKADGDDDDSSGRGSSGDDGDD